MYFLLETFTRIFQRKCTKAIILPNHKRTQLRSALTLLFELTINVQNIQF